MTSERLEAFSDGVIAIIITIIIRIIDLTDGNDMAALMGVLPLVVCYLISFIMVGINWANHNHLLQVTRSVDGKISTILCSIIHLFTNPQPSLASYCIFLTVPAKFRLYYLVQLKVTLVKDFDT